MPLDHEDGPRLTPEQRDRVLDLASRLQARHESTVGIDELAQRASEAGIEARFIYEAAGQIAETQPKGVLSRSGTDWSALAIGLGAAALVNFAFTRIYFSTHSSLMPFFQIVFVALCLAIGVALGRRRMALWTPVLGSFVIVLLTSVFLATGYSFGSFLPTLQMTVGSALYTTIFVLAGCALARVPAAAR